MEDEIKKIKEELKKELLEELKGNKKYTKPEESDWTKIRKEYAEKFRKYDYKDTREYFNVYNNLVKSEHEVKVADHMIGAIGTLVKAVYESPHIQRVKANYDDIKDFTEDIYQVIEKHKNRYLNERCMRYLNE